MENLLHFEAGFEYSNTEEWKAAISKDLKGITFEDLTSMDRNGIPIQPFYTAADKPLSFDKNPDWYIMEQLESGNEIATNTLSLSLLNNGITGLHFKVNENSDLNVLLANIDLKYIHLHLEYDGEDYAAFQSKINTYIQKEYPADFKKLSVQLSSTAPYTITTDSIHINGEIYNNAGANAVLELGSIMAQLNEALHNTPVEVIQNIKTIYIQIAVDTWFYEQISKLRALRALAAQVLKGYNVAATVFIAARTSHIYLATVDYYNNILRNALSGMAATIGGADSLYIYDFADAKEVSFRRRLSRNQQLVFKEEAHLNIVADKSKGAYFIENYSQEIAQAAWKHFQEIENMGGWNAVIESGQLSSWIQTQAQELISYYKNSSKVLIGVNKYQMKEPATASILSFPDTFGIAAINIQQQIKS